MSVEHGLPDVWGGKLMPSYWTPLNPWARDAAFALVQGFGWHWVSRWSFAWADAAADEATFQIARTMNRSRADSRSARMRWWRVYAAFPEIYREAAAKVWQSQVIDARKRA